MPQLNVQRWIRTVRLIALTASMAALAGCVTNGGSTTEATNPFEGYSTDEILMTGDTALRSGEYDRALFLYMQAIDIEETAETWHRVGVTKIRLGDDVFAWRAFSKAVELDPENSESFEELGLLAMSFGQPEQATEFLTKAIELDEDNRRWRSHNALGVMADVDKRYADAVVNYKKALAMKENSAMLMNNIGYSYYLAGNLQDATFWFDEAFQAQRDYEPAIKNLALLYAREGWYSDAVKTFKKVMPEPEAYNDTGYIALRNGDLEDAAELLTKAIRLSPSYYELAYENLEQVKEEQERRAEMAGSNNTDGPLTGDNVSNIIMPDNHESKVRKVMPQALNVRAEPSPDAEIVTYLRTGDKVEIIMSQPGWAFISFSHPGGTVKGWVNTRFLDDDSIPAENSDAQARAVE